MESYVNKTPFLELCCSFDSAIQALEHFRTEPVDLLFLDIQMPEFGGMEFSKLVPKDTKIIFTTAFSQYALDSYKVNALDYLLKPISYPDFLGAANKALEWFEMKSAGQAATPNAESIFVKTEYKLIQIELKKILYIEGLKDYVKIFVEDEPHAILSLMSMKMMEDMLPADTFVRVHRSFIVRPDKIKVIERNRIVFGKEYIPISETYKQAFVDFLSQRSLLPKGF
jgi:DNA-binding LytR/AlgR family response regulator